MDPRVIVAIRRIYKNGIPFEKLEQALIEIEAFASALHQTEPQIRTIPAKKLVISPPPVAAPVQKRGRGRPPGAKNKTKASTKTPSKTQARAVAPRAELEAPGDVETEPEVLVSNGRLGSDLAAQAEAILSRGPATMAQLQEELHLGDMSPGALLVRIGAKPVGEIELEDGSVLKTYGLGHN